MSGIDEDVKKRPANVKERRKGRGMMVKRVDQQRSRKWCEQQSRRFPPDCCHKCG